MVAGNKELLVYSQVSQYNVKHFEWLERHEINTQSGRRTTRNLYNPHENRLQYYCRLEGRFEGERDSQLR